MTRRCLVCGEYFDTTKTGRYKYCSKECAKSINNNNHPKDLSALRYNKPMQVELEADGYSDGELVYDWGKCPKCGWEFENGDKDWEEPYCCHCGQKLHWFNCGARMAESEQNDDIEAMLEHLWNNTVEDMRNEKFEELEKEVEE